MKIGILLVCLMLLTTACYANAGNALEWWLKAQDKFDGALVETCNEKITKWVVEGVEKPTPQELEAIISDYESSYIEYNAQACKTALFSAFQASLSELQPYYPVIGDCLSYGNDTSFTVLKTYCEGLVTAGAVSQDTYNSFKAILLSNGVNLENY